MPRFTTLILWLVFFSVLSAPCLAQQAPPRKKLIVGTKSVRPFAFKEDGVWRGISIELWAQIAKDLKYEFEWREVKSTDELIAKVAKGDFDLGIAAITMKPKRARVVDFSNSIFESGVAITARKEDPGALSMLAQLFSLEIAEAVGSLIALLALVGLLVWLLERKQNPEEFGGQKLKGFWEGFWWSAVTMTTVGYGDKSPKSFGGRILGLIWMFASIIMISTFTAAIASSLTTQKLQSVIRGPEDLPHVRVGAMKNESPIAILRDQGIRVAEKSSVKGGLKAVRNGDLDAFVHDMPVLQFEILNDPDLHDVMTILPKLIREEEYGIAFHPPEDKTRRNKLREKVNVALLEMKMSGAYSKLLRRYLGN
jgi:polar amino acid transport system substrate-binding protein